MILGQGGYKSGRCSAWLHGIPSWPTWLEYLEYYRRFKPIPPFSITEMFPSHVMHFHPDVVHGVLAFYAPSHSFMSAVMSGFGLAPTPPHHCWKIITQRRDLRVVERLAVPQTLCKYLRVRVGSQSESSLGDWEAPVLPSRRDPQCRRGRVQGGGNFRGTSNFAWEISRFKLTAKFPTRNSGFSANFSHTGSTH